MITRFLKQLFRFVVLIILINSCSDNKKNEHLFFENYKLNKELEHHFTIDSYHKINDSLYGYQHEFSFWVGNIFCNRFLSNIMYSGSIFEYDRIIYIVPLGTKKPIKYFDFNSRIDDTSSTQIVSKRLGFMCDTIIDTLKYKVYLVDKSYSEKYKDTIFMFAFNEIGAIAEGDALVFYVGIHCGPIGIYNGEIVQEKDLKKEYIISYVGDIFIESSKERKRIFNAIVQ